MNQDVKKVLAGLQSRIDHLETELSYLNELLLKCGFDKGIQTLKETAEELVAEIGIASGE